MPDEEVKTVAEVTEHFDKLLSSDSEEVSEQTDIIKEEEAQPQTEEVAEEIEEQPQEEETVESEEEVKEEEALESEAGDWSFKADGKMVTPKDLTELKKHASMGYHAEQKNERVNIREREANQTIQRYNDALRNVESKTETSKKAPVTQEELPSHLVKEEITEDDEIDGIAGEKREKNALKDELLQNRREIGELKDMVYNQETNIYAGEIEGQFLKTEKMFENVEGVKFDDVEKDRNGMTQRAKIKDNILLLYDRGQRVLHNNPDYFIKKGYPLSYTMQDAFYEWMGTQTSTPQSSKSLTVAEIKKNEKLYNDLKEDFFTEEAKKEENAEPIIQKKGKPPIKDDIDEVLDNREEGESYSDAITRNLKKKHPNFRI